jgi:hypothetical protein
MVVHGWPSSGLLEAKESGGEVSSTTLDSSGLGARLLGLAAPSTGDTRAEGRAAVAWRGMKHGAALAPTQQPHDAHSRLHDAHSGVMTQVSEGGMVAEVESPHWRPLKRRASEMSPTSPTSLPSSLPGTTQTAPPPSALGEYSRLLLHSFYRTAPLSTTADQASAQATAVETALSSRDPVGTAKGSYQDGFDHVQQHLLPFSPSPLSPPPPPTHLHYPHMPQQQEHFWAQQSRHPPLGAAASSIANTGANIGSVEDRMPAEHLVLPSQHPVTVPALLHPAVATTPVRVASELHSNPFKQADSSLQAEILALTTATQRGVGLACMICGKTFTYKQHMKTHVKTVHLRMKEYECAVCHRKFGEKTALNKHLKGVHIKERPFRCERCFTTFAQKSHLDKHHQRISGCDVAARNKEAADDDNYQTPRTLHPAPAHADGSDDGESEPDDGSEPPASPDERRGGRAGDAPPTPPNPAAAAKGGRGSMQLRRNSSTSSESASLAT